MCNVKGTAMNRPSVVTWEDVRIQEAFYSPMIRSQSLSETVFVNCELQECFPAFPPLKWERKAQVGWSWVFS